MDGIPQQSGWRSPLTSLFRDVAEKLGVSLEVITFLVALFSSVPVAWLTVLMPGPTAKSLYSTVAGAALCYVAYGGAQASMQLWAPTLLTYVVVRCTPRRCGYPVFVAAFAYLVYCHAVSLSGDAWRRGGIDFTGTLMVLTLKLVGCAMDVQDGHSRIQDDQVGHRMYFNRLEETPSLLDFLGFVFFPGGVLVGPVYDFHSYRAFIRGEEVWSASDKALPSPSEVAVNRANGNNRKLNGNDGIQENRTDSVTDDVGKDGSSEKTSRSRRRMPNPLPYAFVSLAKAVGCLAVYQTLNTVFTASYLSDPLYFRMPLLARWGYLWAVGFAFRWMYYFIWSVAESAMIASGLGFSGWSRNETTRPDWSRAVNADILKCEVTSSAAQLPAFWNIWVGRWLRTYVYDRLTPLSGKPTVWTLIATQVVSALWHGLHPGYYLFFVNSAIVQQASKVMYKLHQTIPDSLAAIKAASAFSQPIIARLLLCYGQLGFIVLRGDQTLAVWRSLYYTGTWVPIIVAFVLPQFIRWPKRRKTE